SQQLGGVVARALSHGVFDRARARLGVARPDLRRQMVLVHEGRALIQQLLSELRHWRGARALDACGEGTRVPGGVDKRGAGSRIEVGRGCLISGMLVTETPGSVVRIGNNVLVGGDSLIAAASSIVVEDDVLISYRCIIT